MINKRQKTQIQKLKKHKKHKKPQKTRKSKNKKHDKPVQWTSATSGKILKCITRIPRLTSAHHGNLAVIQGINWNLSGKLHLPHHNFTYKTSRPTQSTWLPNGHNTAAHHRGQHTHTTKFCASTLPTYPRHCIQPHETNTGFRTGFELSRSTPIHGHRTPQETIPFSISLFPFFLLLVW